MGVIDELADELFECLQTLADTQCVKEVSLTERGVELTTHYFVGKTGEPCDLSDGLSTAYGIRLMPESIHAAHEKILQLEREIQHMRIALKAKESG